MPITEQVALEAIDRVRSHYDTLRDASGRLSESQVEGLIADLTSALRQRDMSVGGGRHPHRPPSTVPVPRAHYDEVVW